MEKYDVVIIGAGPAGSTAAYYIDGLKVLIVDKFNFPRHKACGGGLMSSRDWHLEFANYAKIKDNLRSCPSNSIKMYWNKLYVANRKFKHLFDQVSRYEFDDMLLKVALEKDNVEFLKFDLKEIQKGSLGDEKGYKLSDGKTDIFTRQIIGADGIYSRVSKFLGNKNLKRHQFGLCLEYDVVCEKKDESIHVIPGFGWEIGYAWLFPTISGYQVGVGMVRKPRKELQKYMDDFLKWIVKKGLVPEKYEIRKRSGGSVPLKVAKKYCTDSILLCGDAMGLVKLLTGEGIYYAMKSGKIAGQVISESRKDIEKRYKKKVRPLILDTFLTPYIPPKIFTLSFWTVFFVLGRLLDNNLRIWNIFLDFFMRMAVHRQKNPDSYYADEKIARER